jgi:hypothetical protein
MVSDRRLIWMPSQRIADDNRNKTVLLCGHFHLGYTGLAEIGHLRTDPWIAGVLKGRQPSEYFKVIREEATAAFAKLPVRPSVKEHTFLAVGWTAFRPNPSELHPVAVVVSNVMDENGNWLQTPQDRFSARAWRIPAGQDHLICWVGQSLEPSERTRLDRYLRRYIDRGGGPGGAARLLATEARIVASRNRLVGKALLISALPKRAVPAQSFSFIAANPPISSHEQSCLYVPEDGVSPVQYGPTTVCPGFMTHGIELWRTRPPWWRD